jgi:hypothetical protein
VSGRCGCETQKMSRLTTLTRELLKNLYYPQNLAANDTVQHPSLILKTFPLECGPQIGTVYFPVNFLAKPLIFQFT